MLQHPFQINDDEVELWVVKAITSKLIDCKMDQMNQVIVVRYVLPQILVSFSIPLAYANLGSHGHVSLNDFCSASYSPQFENSFI